MTTLRAASVLGISMAATLAPAAPVLGDARSDAIVHSLVLDLQDTDIEHASERPRELRATLAACAEGWGSESIRAAW